MILAIFQLPFVLRLFVTSKLIPLPNAIQGEGSSTRFLASITCLTSQCIHSYFPRASPRFIDIRLKRHRSNTRPSSLPPHPRNSKDHHYSPSSINLRVTSRNICTSIRDTKSPLPIPSGLFQSSAHHLVSLQRSSAYFTSNSKYFIGRYDGVDG